jgi:hypothetical protein
MSSDSTIPVRLFSWMVRSSSRVVTPTQTVSPHPKTLQTLLDDPLLSLSYRQGKFA